MEDPLKGFRINRNAEAGVHKFEEVFSGLEDSPALNNIFGGIERLKSVLDKTLVQIVSSHIGYMMVDDDGRVIINRRYLKAADKKILYLDLIHELTHVKQHLEGKELFDERFDYVDRPTEIEAYTVAVEEARRIAMNESEIAEYLKVEWISGEEHRRLLKKLGVMVE